MLVPGLDAPNGTPHSQRAEAGYKARAEQHGLVVRNRSSELGCAGCLRITVGTADENKQCLQLLRHLLAM